MITRGRKPGRLYDAALGILGGIIGKYRVLHLYIGIYLLRRQRQRVRLAMSGNAAAAILGVQLAQLLAAMKAGT